MRTYLVVLRRRIWAVVLTALVIVAVAVAVSLVQTKRYTATAQVLLETPPSVQVGGSAGTAPDLTPTQVQTQIQLITSAPVQAAVARELGTAVAPAVKVTPVGQTDVVALAAVDVSAAHAARIANAYAEAYITSRRTHEVGNLLAAAGQIQSKISELDRQMAGLDYQVLVSPPALQPTLSAQRAALLNQEAAFKTEQAQFQVSSGLQNGAAEVVTPAAVPKSPSSPRPRRNAAIGGALGLILGVGLAFALDYLDGSVRTTEDLQRAGEGLPVLGLIPEVDGWKEANQTRLVTASSPLSPEAEAYRSLRTALQFVGVRRSLSLVQVTSASAEEGKTTTLANLGVTLAQAGQQVVMVCCDLRRPRLHEFFGVDNSTGFTSVLLRSCGLDDAVRPALSELANLFILPSGPAAPNPSELLGTPMAAGILRDLAGRFDVVLVDSPPVLPVTDAAVLSAHVDGTLLVAVAGMTPAKQVERAVDVLRQVNATLMGTVLNGVPNAEYDHSYGYGSYEARVPVNAVVIP